MKAAIYARKSTDDNDRHEDNKSVTRQVEHAKEYAAKKGWAVAEDHLFIDDGISGAEFKNRPALLRLLNQVNEFDVVVMSELSRIGREQQENGHVLANIYSEGVKVFFYLTDEELKFESAVDKFMVTAVSFAAELEREKASQRSRDALLKKAKSGYNTGGHCFGYDNVPVHMTNSAGEKVKSHTDFRINDVQAEVVRGIYKMYADGHGHTTISWTMNGNPEYAAKLRKYFGGKVPTAPRRGKNGTGSWSPSSIRSILYNARYKGLVPFGKHRSVYRKGTKRRDKRDSFLQIDRPDLRIVSESLWNVVQARLREVAATYIRDGGKWWGRPSTEKYLLSGMMKCNCCTRNITVIGGTSGAPGKRTATRFYGCSYHQNRGPAICPNDHRVRMETLDEIVARTFEQQVFTPEAVLYIIDTALLKAEQKLKQSPERPKEIETELKKLHRELANFTQIIAGGKAPRSVLAEIAAREERVTALEREKAELARMPGGLSELDRARLKKVMQARMERFTELLRRDIPVARQALKKMLVEPLRCKPVVVEGRKTFAIEGATVLGPLLDTSAYIGLALPKALHLYIATLRLPIKAVA